MIDLDKYYISWLVEKATQRKNDSGLNRDIKNYAMHLIDNLPDDYGLIFDNQSELEKNLEILKNKLLNGAENWYQYSKGSCAYNGNIAAALCTPSEYRKTKGGEKELNSRESWLDVQARALYQAEILIISTIRAFAYGCFNTPMR